MATTRLLLRWAMSKPQRFGFVEPPMSKPSKTSSSEMRCHDNMVFTADRLHHHDRRIFNDERKLMKLPTSVAAPESAVTVDHPQVDWATELASLVANVSDAALTLSKSTSRWRPRKSHIQMLIERTIIDCRFFTLLAVVGTLLGSVLCFLEGCFIVIESYIQYFYLMSQKADQGHVIQLLIEALDMFLIGTAMLIFGVSLYAMFVGLKSQKETRDAVLRPDSNLFGLYHLKKLPTWVELNSVSHVKSKIGHAVMIILQVGVLEKFKSVPLLSGLDLACFSGALLCCSASIFLLSKLSLNRAATEDR